MKRSRVGGRIAVHVPDHPKANNRGYILEYRYVIEQYLGRYLTKDEHVHHINGDPDDNRLENLQIVTCSEHARIHNNLTGLGRKRTLPYAMIQELMEQGLGYRKIAKSLNINESSTKKACRTIRGAV